MSSSSPALAATTGTAPHWFTGKINQDRFAGSETTYYVMTKLSSLFNQTSIFGCTLQAADLRTCNPAGDGPDTDTLDNWDRNEVTQGAGIGSSGGIGQLCATKPTGGLPVDAARSSRPFDSNKDCSDTVFKQLAKDALVGLTFPNETPPAGSTVGDVSAGWRTGDPVGGPYTGLPFTNLDNIGGTTSLAYRIYCDPNSATRISDWGQLTEAGQPVGSGAPIGVPIIVWGVQTSSGTKSVWDSYVGCDMNRNATAAHVIQENNGPQVRNVLAAENGGAGTVATVQAIGASLYMQSFGYYQSNAYSRGGGIATKINGVGVTGAKITSASPPVTVRTLYNVYRKSTLRASTAGFLNWIHVNDSTQHGVDLTNGKNYQAEIDNVIGTQYGFPRVYDTLIPAADIADLTT